MREELRSYYERELTYLRSMGEEFKTVYPGIAARLGIQSDRCDDPHTERLLQGFAFLAARIHLKLDDEFPEISTALLDLVYPHYLRPIPSMTVVEFQCDPDQGKPSTQALVKRGTALYAKENVEDVCCKFQTCYDTSLWPVQVTSARWLTPDQIKLGSLPSDIVGAIKLSLQCLPDVTFESLGVRSLRFYLSGKEQLPYTLYELLCSKCSYIAVTSPGGEPVSSVAEQPVLRPVGLEAEEAALPYSRRSFEGYRLLQEYFSFPEKFLFIELSEMHALSRLKDKAEVIFLISSFEKPERRRLLEEGLSASTFRLNCTPAVNLFQKTAEGILLDQTKFEYPIVPSVSRPFAFEIFSIDSVVRTNPLSTELTQFNPFYSRRTTDEAKTQTYWYASRKASSFHGSGRSDTYLSLVDISGRRARPDRDTLTVRCACTNSDLPSRLTVGRESGDFEAEGISGLRRIVGLRKPTVTARPLSERRTLWNLVSHLSLNYLSLIEEGTESLQLMLGLYSSVDQALAKRQISGISKINSVPCTARIMTEGALGVARGLQIQIHFDEENYVGSGAYLFASILERFFAMYVGMNSFTQLVATTTERMKPLGSWLPRSGRSIVA